MGTRERRQREVAQREQRILDTAQELIRRDGLLHLQMSRLAEACDHAVGTLYQHFAKKEDLLVALCARHARARVELFRRASDWPGGTRERLLAIALVDTLALEQCPEVFRLDQFVFTEVVWGAASPQWRQVCLDACAPMGDIVCAITREALDNGDLPATVEMTPLEATIGTWTQCLGMHTLMHATGVLDQYDIVSPQLLLFKHLNHMLNGYGWQPLMPRVDDAAVREQMQRLNDEVLGTLSPCPGLYATGATDSTIRNGSTP